jgi:hypothetical protein
MQNSILECKNGQPFDLFTSFLLEKEEHILPILREAVTYAGVDNI